MGGVASVSFSILIIALGYQFPFVVGSIIFVLFGLYQFYLKFLCIKASMFPRKSPMTDTTQRLKSYPPVYPNGWYHLANCDEINKGEVIQVEGVGRKFAVWRSSKGVVSVLDAFCPHGGANLCGGKVVGDSLLCPFHFWEFATSGAVTKVPWLDEPPAHIKAKCWTCREFHGMIIIWFDAENREPLYEAPIVEPIKSGEMRYCGKWEVDRPIHMHLVEYMENTVDVQHFTPMHGQMCIPWTTIKIPGIEVLFDAKIVLGSEPEGAKLGPVAPSEQFLYFLNTSSLKFCGTPIPKTTASVKVQFIGPATLNRFIFNIPELGDIVMFQTHLPLNEHSGLALRVRFSWYASKNVPDALASYVVGEWVSNWWFDVGVWEEKIRLNTPGLVKGDGPIAKGRRWYKQFYTDKSKEVSTPVNFDW